MSNATDETVTVVFDPNSINLQSDVIFPVSSTKAGVMPPAMLKTLPIGSNKTIVVDNGATPAHGSVPTIAAALASGANNIQLTPTGINYQWPVGTLFLPELVGLGAAPLVISGPMSAPLVNGTESVGGDTATLTDGSLAMTPSAHRGQFAQITSGALAGTMVCIVDNTATAVSLQSSIGSIGIGDTWVIVEPAVTLEFPDTAPINICDGTIGFSKLNLLDPTNNSLVQFFDVTWVMQTCTVNGFIGNGIGLARCVIDTFATTFLWSSLGNSSPFATPSASSFYSNTTVIFTNLQTAFSCFVVGDNFIYLTFFGCTSNFLDANIRGADIEIFGNCWIRFINTNGSVVKSTLDGSAFGSSSLVLVDVGSTFYSSPSASGEVVMKNSSGSALVVDRGSYARPGNVTGTGNATAGIELNRMGRVTTAASTVTGAEDLLFDGSSTTKAYGDLPFADVDFSQAAV